MSKINKKGRHKIERAKLKAKKKADKKAKFLAQRNAGKKKRQEGVAQSLTRYGKVQGGYRTFPGTPPNATQQEKKPSKRNRPAKGFDAATKTWVR